MSLLRGIHIIIVGEFLILFVGSTSPLFVGFCSGIPNFHQHPSCVTEWQTIYTAPGKLWYSLLMFIYIWYINIQYIHIYIYIYINVIIDNMGTFPNYNGIAKHIHAILRAFGGVDHPGSYHDIPGVNIQKDVKKPWDFSFGKWSANGGENPHLLYVEGELIGGYPLHIIITEWYPH